MLNTEQERIITDWITALKSGEYQQIIKHYFKDGAYCAFAVLANILGIPESRYSMIYHTKSPLWEVFDWPVRDGDKTIDFYTYIVLMNDHYGKTFEDIAIFLETYFDICPQLEKSENG